MQPIHIPSRVGEDGVLTLSVPLGAAEANAEVLVTIELAGIGTPAAGSDRREFVRQTYGSCAGLSLDEPPDMPLQQRDWN